MKKIFLSALLLAFSSSVFSVTCDSTSINGTFNGRTTNATEKVSSITYNMQYSGIFAFTGAAGVSTGTVTYYGQGSLWSGNRFDMTGTGTYAVTPGCLVTINMTWTVFSVAIPGSVFNLYTFGNNAVPTTSLVYHMAGIETTPLLSTNKITQVAGNQSSTWQLDKVNN